jgi:hypothetical protein
MRVPFLPLLLVAAFTCLQGSERQNLQVQRLAVVNGTEIPVTIPVETFLGLSLNDKGREEAAQLAQDCQNYAKDCRRLAEKGRELAERWREFADNHRVPLP